MDIHPILLVDRRTNVVLEVVGGDPDVNAAGDIEWFPFLGCYIIPFLGTTGASLGLGVSGFGDRG